MTQQQKSNVYIQMQIKSTDDSCFKHCSFLITLDNHTEISVETNQIGQTVFIELPKLPKIKTIKLIAPFSDHKTELEYTPYHQFQIHNLTRYITHASKHFFFDITLKLVCRSLSENETALLKMIFKNSIDFKKVKIHQGKFLYFGLQNALTAMAPKGEIYFPTNLYQHDFTMGMQNELHLFIHEMVHIWQYQLGYSLLKKGIINALTGAYLHKKIYRYRQLIQDKHDQHLSDFNMEQQANIIADYFIYKIQNKPIKQILKQFIDNPNDTSLLPK